MCEASKKYHHNRARLRALRELEERKPPDAENVLQDVRIEIQRRVVQDATPDPIPDFRIRGGRID
eukprot:6317598-Karenia_brevis.AAC.1